jgi:hypothetical protein
MSGFTRSPRPEEKSTSFSSGYFFRANSDCRNAPVLGLTVCKLDARPSASKIKTEANKDLSLNGVKILGVTALVWRAPESFLGVRRGEMLHFN